MQRRRGVAPVRVLVVTTALWVLLVSSARAQTAAPPGPLEREQADEDARTFVTDMAVAGMAEVQFATLASSRAASAEVKAFGQQMAADHATPNAELSQVASRVKLTVPTELDEKHRNLAAVLSGLKGAAFDRAYLTAVVQGHEDVARMLRARTTAKPSDDTVSGAGIDGSSRDADDAQDARRLTQWAAKMLPIVQRHLARARELQRKVTR